MDTNNYVPLTAREVALTLGFALLLSDICGLTEDEIKRLMMR